MSAGLAVYAQCAGSVRDGAGAATGRSADPQNTSFALLLPQVVACDIRSEPPRGCVNLKNHPQWNALPCHRPATNPQIQGPRSFSNMLDASPNPREARP